ncbi:hypothetical protein BC831DRAFT_513155 [Entophlyctis helioformis]|nr:hypothetical protein BC831DRAFT_513155 [Entophlyctis helioformis]
MHDAGSNSISDSDNDVRPLRVAAVTEAWPLPGLNNARPWRMNLLAVSGQDPSKAFLALDDSIHVFEVAGGPSPAYSDPPLTVLQTRTGAAINAIRVGQLGTEEMLVSVDDNGNVRLFYTAHLSRPPICLLTQDSAWGCALHGPGRLLAVSSNAHIVRVYHLAAVESSSSSLSSTGDRHHSLVQSVTAMDLQSDAMPDGLAGDAATVADDANINDDRGLDQRPREATGHPLGGVDQRDLVGHTNNIPYIDFTPDGHHLISCSIDNTCRVWSVRTGETVLHSKIGSDWNWSCKAIRTADIRRLHHAHEIWTHPARISFNPFDRDRTSAAAGGHPSFQEALPFLNRLYQSLVGATPGEAAAASDAEAQGRAWLRRQQARRELRAAGQAIGAAAPRREWQDVVDGANAEAAAAAAATADADMEAGLGNTGVGQTSGDDDTGSDSAVLDSDASDASLRERSRLLPSREQASSQSQSQSQSPVTARGQADEVNQGAAFAQYSKQPLDEMMESEYGLPDFNSGLDDDDDDYGSYDDMDSDGFGGYHDSISGGSSNDDDDDDDDDHNDDDDDDNDDDDDDVDFDVDRQERLYAQWMDVLLASAMEIGDALHEDDHTDGGASAAVQVRSGSDAPHATVFQSAAAASASTADASTPATSGSSSSYETAPESVPESASPQSPHLPQQQQQQQHLETDSPLATPPVPHKRRKYGTTELATSMTPAVDPLPPYIILHTTVEDVYLLNGSTLAVECHVPKILCGWDTNRAYRGLERLCMTEWIPELSLAVVASQRGRLAAIRVLRTTTPAGTHNYTLKLESWFPMQGSHLSPILGMSVSRHVSCIDPSLTRFQIHVVTYDSQLYVYELRSQPTLFSIERINL